MAPDGYRFSAEYLAELQAAVAQRLDAERDAVFIRAAQECTRALAVALEGPAEHPIDPPAVA